MTNQGRETSSRSESTSNRRRFLRCSRGSTKSYRTSRFVLTRLVGRDVTDHYEIETERLLLRQWRDGDWHDLHRTYSDQEVMSWIGTNAADLAATAAAVGRMSMHWRLLGYGMFAVEERASRE